MSNERWERIKQVFNAVMARPPAERAGVLDQQCAGDAELRREVESLLLTARPTELLGAVRTGGAAEALASASTLGGPIIERAGTIIGPYKLLQVIGEGGFGTVFMAEQSVPVRRRVALKIIKLGMDTRLVVARFEAERQALAIMDHPHIAKVLDGGVTPMTVNNGAAGVDAVHSGAGGGGRPYFVMEYVTGDPITRFATAHKLSIKERLNLFAQVCAAVQHAHTKGVILRVIKPGNVLASMTDGKPFAKVIDFGIAKATAQPLTDKTLFTEHRQLIGTPEYMSPEQAEGSADIDTRTDVYALGVLLYELLTGLTPFDGKRLRSAAYGEMQRIIKEEEPPMPSVRLSRAALGLSMPEFGVGSAGSSPRAAAALAAATSAATPTSAQIKGELDWIVMKALDKDRARRYDTPNQLAADVQRHLAGEAVVAAPPSAAYRLRKFVRRNKGPVVTVSAVILALAAGGSVAAWQANRLAAERTRAFNGLGRMMSQLHEMIDGPRPAAGASLESIQIFDANGNELAAGDPLGQLVWQAETVSAELVMQTNAANWSAYIATLFAAQSALAANDYPEARRIMEHVPKGKVGWEGRYLSHIAESNHWVKSGLRLYPVGLTSQNQIALRDQATNPKINYLIDLGTGELTEGVPTGPLALFRGTLDAGGSLAIRDRLGADYSTWYDCFRWDRAGQALLRLLTRPALDAPFVSFTSDSKYLVWLDSGESIEGPEAVRLIPVAEWGGPETAVNTEAYWIELYIARLLSSSPLPPVPTRDNGLTLTTPVGTRIIKGSADGTVRFFEAKDGKPTLPATAESPEGTLREVAVFRMTASVTNLQMTGDGTRLIISLADGSARVWDIREPEERRKDLQAEWAERVPAGEYLDTLWNAPPTQHPTESLREAIITDKSLTPLRRLVAVELLEERTQDTKAEAERALFGIFKDQTDPATVQAKAQAAELPPRVKTLVVASAAEWKYSPPVASDAEKLADAEAFSRCGTFDAAERAVTLSAVPTAAAMRYMNRVQPQSLEFGDNFDASGDDTIRMLAATATGLKALTSLDLQGTSVTDEGLKSLSAPTTGLKSLLTLSLSGKNVTNDGLKALAANDTGLKSLTSLTIILTNVSDDGLKALAAPDSGLKALTSLYLHQNKVSAGGLKALAAPESALKALTKLKLWETNVTDDDLKAISANDTGLKALTALDLWSTNVTDDGLKALAAPDCGLKALTTLDLSGSKVTDETIAAIKQRFPGIKIER